MTPNTGLPKSWVPVGAVLLVLWGVGSPAKAQMGRPPAGGNFGSGNSSGGFSGSSFSGGFSGSSFSGGFSGSSFSGGFSGGFSGSSFSGGFSGSSFSGGTMQGGNSFRPLGNTTGINRLPTGRASASDPFAATRGNPLTMGQFGGTQQLAGVNFAGQTGGLQFGTTNPLLSRGTGLTTGNFSGANSFGNFTGSGLNNFGGRTGMNQRGMTATPMPGYILRPGFSPPRPPTSEVVGQLNQTLTNAAASFPAGQNVKVFVEDGVLVLRGRVPTEGDKMKAEMLVRLEPGVYSLRNEIEVAPADSVGPQP